MLCSSYGVTGKFEFQVKCEFKRIHFLQYGDVLNSSKYPAFFNRHFKALVGIDSPIFWENQMYLAMALSETTPHL